MCVRVCVCLAHPSARAAVLISAVVLCGRQTENRHRETDKQTERETATGDCLLYYLDIRTLIDEPVSLYTHVCMCVCVWVLMRN